MTSLRPATTPTRRVLQILATVVGAFIVLSLMGGFGSGSDQSSTSLTTQSLLPLPNSGNNLIAEPTAIPTTAPLQLPTATATPLPTSAPVPTPAPTATAVPTPTPIPTAAPIAAADAGTAAVDPGTAPAETTAESQAVPVETATPEPTVTTVADLTPSAPLGDGVPPIIVEATPTVENFGFPTTEPADEPTVAPTPTPTATPEPAWTAADMEAYVLREINDVRAKAGLGPVALDPAISAISRDWSQQMALGGFFEHRPGSELNVMLPTGWLQWGENIASAPDIFYAQSSLENSPGHYANMVGPFTVVGIGVYTNGSQVWVTHNFARY